MRQVSDDFLLTWQASEAPGRLGLVRRLIESHGSGTSAGSMSNKRTPWPPTSTPPLGQIEPTTWRWWNGSCPGCCPTAGCWTRRAAPASTSRCCWPAAAGCWGDHAGAYLANADAKFPAGPRAAQLVLADPQLGRLGALLIGGPSQPGTIGLGDPLRLAVPDHRERARAEPPHPSRRQRQQLLLLQRPPSGGAGRQRADPGPPARGPQAANVVGLVDQTDLFHIMASALRVG
jgi:hypothetical protein